MIIIIIILINHLNGLSLSTQVNVDTFVFLIRKLTF